MVVWGGLMTAGAYARGLAGAILDGGVVVPRALAEEVFKLSQEIDMRELEQAKLIVQSGSLKEGLAKYGRI